jgi:hypothetical protein
MSRRSEPLLAARSLEMNHSHEVPRGAGFMLQTSGGWQSASFVFHESSSQYHSGNSKKIA